MIMLHSSSALKALGKLVAERSELELEELGYRYAELFKKALSRSP